MILQPAEVAHEFDGGLALFRTDGQLVSAAGPAADWTAVLKQIPGYLAAVQQQNQGSPLFSKPFSSQNNSRTLVLVGATDRSPAGSGRRFHSGRINPGCSQQPGQRRANHRAGDQPGSSSESYQVLYRGGPLKTDESAPTHPGIHEAIAGESGINYFQSGQGEHVVAFSPILSVGWGLVIEEAWEDIASPYLSSTQSAPLVLVPLFLLALVALWFGASRIVRPLQNLEKQAANLARGNFDTIHHPVGGIEEIRNLQAELVDMADELKAAQHSLRSYIGAITSGIENERRSLARELHDETIQALIALNQRIQLAQMNAPESQKMVLV